MTIGPSPAPVYTTPPSEEDIRDMAEAALAALPPRLSGPLAGVAILVEELADDATLDAVGVESPWDLTGLYQGVPLTERSIADPVHGPDRIVLYRAAILAEWVETGEDLARLVASVLVHEAAHHFGMTDAEIEKVEKDLLF